MKFFKYIALLLLVAVTMGSCDKKDVSYMVEPVDESVKAYVQVGYYAPVTAGAANYMYYIDINGVEYGNSGSTFLATFNTVPSGGTNRYYAVDAGNINLKLHSRVKVGETPEGEPIYEYPIVYDQNVTVEAGKRYCIYVHDLNKAPIPIEMAPAPEFGKALGLIPIRCAACNSSTCSMNLTDSPTPARCSMVFRTLIPKSMSLLANPLASVSAPRGGTPRFARPFITVAVRSVVRFACLPWTTTAR